MLTKQDSPSTGSGPCDPYKAREAWLSIVKPAANRGKLEKLPTIKAKTTVERDTARKQNYYLTRTVFGNFGENYDRINWEHSRD